MTVYRLEGVAAEPAWEPTESSSARSPCQTQVGGQRKPNRKAQAPTLPAEVMDALRQLRKWKVEVIRVDRVVD